MVKELKTQKRLKKIPTILMITIFIASTIFLGIAVPRMALAQEITEQFNFEQDGSNFEMSLFVENTVPIENAFNAFQIFTADNLEWVGQIPAGQGQEIDIHLTLGTARMEESHLFITDLLLTENINDLVNVHVEAANATLDFNNLETDPESAEIVAVLKDVNFGISMSIIPIPGLTSALYSYSGPELTLTIRLYARGLVTILNPEEGDINEGIVDIQAEVLTPEGMAIEDVWLKPIWYSDPSWDGHMELIEEFEERQHMTWNETSEQWEGQWFTRETPDGEYVLEAMALIVDESTGEEFIWGSQQITVEVFNEQWRIGERIRISGESQHSNLPADEPYYVAHGWLHDRWYDMSEEERDEVLFGDIGFELELKEQDSDKWKTVNLEYWLQYHRWGYFGEPGDEYFERGEDMMLQYWHVEYEAYEFEPGVTYTFKGTWTWPIDPDDPEDTGFMERIIDITFN